MRTTLNLDDALLEQARKSTGVKEKTRLLHLGLEALIQREEGRRHADTGGAPPTEIPSPMLPVSKCRGGLGEGMASLAQAVAAADLAADQQQAG